MVKKGNGWKVATIILSIDCFFLLVVIVIETLVIVGLFALGAQLEEMEAECADEICAGDEFTSYYFDDYEEKCYCYNATEVVVEKKMEWN